MADYGYPVEPLESYGTPGLGTPVEPLQSYGFPRLRVSNAAFGKLWIPWAWHPN